LLDTVYWNKGKDIKIGHVSKLCFSAALSNSWFGLCHEEDKCLEWRKPSCEMRVCEMATI
jgi:hypothetical protein